ncbi:unnamed protein product [Ambrosiozyma monospora]|uniref:Unnamed protein product n=1 Tax=Ambrosiozyma monospora TaxID=43982 RepID=A0ACB5TLR3_AMBMO|nr:unnamed protein product [Ambrosiozyma monospora]
MVMVQYLSPIKALAFNQDYSCLAVGYDTQYKVFNSEPFGDCFHKDDDGGASKMEMLFSTSLMAVVGLGDKPSNSTRKLKIINTKRKSVICELSFPTSVLYVKLNRKRLIVALINQVFIYDVSCMKLLHTIESDTTSMGQVVADLCSNDDSILAFSLANSNINNGAGSPSIHSTGSIGDGNNNNNSNNGSEGRTTGAPGGVNLNSSVRLGSVVLFDALNIQPINQIDCHNSPLQKIALSKDGKLLATCSTKGTIIRVFSTKNGKKVHEFRRGSWIVD